MSINSKRDKIYFNWRKTQQMPKGKKIKLHVFWCVYDKAFSVFKKIRLIIHQKKVGFALWPMLKEFWYLKLTRLYVTFSTMTTRERESWWIVDVDPRSLKPSNTFWTCEILSFIAMNHSLHYVLLKALFD